MTLKAADFVNTYDADGVVTNGERRHRTQIKMARYSAKFTRATMYSATESVETAHMASQRHRRDRQFENKSDSSEDIPKREGLGSKGNKVSMRSWRIERAILKR